MQEGTWFVEEALEIWTYNNCTIIRDRSRENVSHILNTYRDGSCRQQPGLGNCKTKGKPRRELQRMRGSWNSREIISHSKLIGARNGSSASRYQTI